MKKILLTITALFTLVACNETKEIQSVEKVDTVSETFLVTDISNGDLRGELVEGTGEGIFYNLHEIERFIDVEVGDVITVSWEKENYVNEEWELIFDIIEN